MNTQKNMCYDEIRLCAQNVDTTLGSSTVSITIGIDSLCEHFKRIFTFTSYNFCTSPPILETWNDNLHDWSQLLTTWDTFLTHQSNVQDILCVELEVPTRGPQTLTGIQKVGIHVSGISVCYTNLHCIYMCGINDRGEPAVSYKSNRLSLGGCTVLNLYESTWVHRRGIDLDLAVLHIHTINTFRTEKYSRILTLNIYLKWNTSVYKGI
jgi:hypothetical protein